MTRSSSSSSGSGPRRSRSTTAWCRSPRHAEWILRLYEGDLQELLHPQIQTGSTSTAPRAWPSDAKRFNGNSGLQPSHHRGRTLKDLAGEHRGGLLRSLANSDAGHIFAINGAKFTGKTDPAAQKKAIKPVGEWNEEEIVCKDGKISCKINGVEVGRGHRACRPRPRADRVAVGRGENPVPQPADQDAELNREFLAETRR